VKNTLNFTALSTFFLSFCLSLLFIGCSDVPGPIEDSRNNDYALYDTEGNLHRFSRYNDSKAIVLMVQGNGCPMVRTAYPIFDEIAKEYMGKGFTFFLLNANLQDSRLDIVKEKKEFNYTLPILLDSTQILADMIDVRVTSEVFVLHPTTRKVLYRGPIKGNMEYEASDRKSEKKYLEDFLDEIAANRLALSTKVIPSKGCAVTRLTSLEKSSGKQISYEKEVAPILLKNCVQCHNTAGMAPWPMQRHSDLVGWGYMIKQVLLSRRMPPWKLSPLTTNMKNDFSIDEMDRRTLLKWVEQGMLKDSNKDPLLAFQPDTSYWKGGVPDTIIKLKPEYIPATGLLPYRQQDVQLHFNETKYLRAIEVRPNEKRSLHHLLTSHTFSNNQSKFVNRKTIPWFDGFNSVYSGVDNLYEYPNGKGIRVDKNSKMSFQFHLTPFGKRHMLETEVGLYFYKQQPPNEIYGLSVLSFNLDVRPFDKRSVFTAVDTLVSDITLFSVLPHQHYRGKSMKIWCENERNEKVVLVDVVDYNFNWQFQYDFVQPIKLKKGTKIFVEGVFDNSFQNPINPDPSQHVSYGIQSDDEMLVGIFLISKSND
jgi:hypothetical protein